MRIGFSRAFCLRVCIVFFFRRIRCCIEDDQGPFVPHDTTFSYLYNSTASLPGLVLVLVTFEPPKYRRWVRPEMSHDFKSIQLR